MKILVLCGGLSPEHDVSMKSGSLIAAALAQRGHSVALCDIFRPVASQKYAAFGKGGGEIFDIPKEPTSLSSMRAEYSDGRQIGHGVLELAMRADLCFLALHGGFGEDGHVQAVLESYGIKFTGSKMAACHASMDKNISKLLCRRAGVRVPEGILVFRGEKMPDVSFPAVVKPCGCGSSVGVSFVYGKEQLESALCAAFEYDDGVIVEDMIDGREFSVSVLGDTALPSVEIIPRGESYDFVSKYQAGMTDEICPGRLTKEEEARVGALALAAHRALGMDDFSRSDFILGNDGKFYYLETNALPGMTKTSLLPLAAKTAGIEYGELCEKICALALERNKK